MVDSCFLVLPAPRASMYGCCRWMLDLRKSANRFHIFEQTLTSLTLCFHPMDDSWHTSRTSPAHMTFTCVPLIRILPKRRVADPAKSRCPRMVALFSDGHQTAKSCSS